MKVLFISGADQQYGTFQMSKQILKNVNKRNRSIEFVVITQTYGPLNDWCNSNSVENHVLSYKYCVYHPMKNIIFNQLKHFIKRLVVSISNLIAYYNLQRSGFLKGIDIIHTNINRDLFGVFISQKTGIPNVTYLREFSRIHFGLKPLYKNQIRLMNRYSSAFIAISNAVKNDWIDYGLDAMKIQVIYDGVDTQKYISKPYCKHSIFPLKIIMCGAIYEGKGQKEILEAVSALIKQNYNICLDYYGNPVSDSYYKDLINYICDNGIQNNIRFMGYNDNLNEIIREYDVGVICSKAEGFGIVTIEYLLSGLTVVASATGANPELLQNGEYGYLYPLGDIEQLCQIISNIYNKHAEKQDKNEKSIRYAQEKFAIENTAILLENVYHSLITENQEVRR